MVGNIITYYYSIQLLKKHTLNPEITLLNQIPALFPKVLKICNIDFWIENDPPPLWNFSENSSDLVAPTFPNTERKRFKMWIMRGIGGRFHKGWAGHSDYGLIDRPRENIKYQETNIFTSFNTCYFVLEDKIRELRAFAQ